MNNKLATRIASNTSALIAQQLVQYSQLQMENEELIKKVKEKENKIKDLEYQLDTLRKGDSNGRHGQPNTTNKQGRHQCR